MARVPGRLTDALASRFARVALGNVVAEYPNKLDHLMDGPDDVRSPSSLHPAFYGSYDWHSCVHMHWTLATLLATRPAMPEAGAIARHFDAHLTAEKVEGELAYLERPAARGFERPYGWGWLLELAAALHAGAKDDGAFAAWRDALEPLAQAFARRFVAHLPLVLHPSRTGMHGNSAFASLLALDYAEATRDHALRDALVGKAHAWFAGDRDYPVAYELSSEDFLSPGLVEAALMRRVFAVDADPHEADARFWTWWSGFVPDFAAAARWLAPVAVSDRTDARIAHLDGLNLSRAWCWSLLADAMPAGWRPAIDAAIDAHLDASLPHAAEGEYVGTHWLASFALLALLARPAVA